MTAGSPVFGRPDLKTGARGAGSSRFFILSFISITCGHAAASGNSARSAVVNLGTMFAIVL